MFPKNCFTQSFLALFASAASLLLLPGELITQAAAQKNARNQSASGPGALAPDKGKLKILLDGKTVGSEEFEIAPAGDAWLARGTTNIEVPGTPRTRITSTFRLQGAAPQSYEWSSQGEKKVSATVTFHQGVASIQLLFEGAKPFLQELTFGSPQIAILDNNVYHHYAILARIFDWSKRGPQNFPVLIPQDMTPGSITVEPGANETVDGASFQTLKVSSPDLVVVLYLDSAHRLMRLAVPASNVAVIRE